MPTEKRYMYEIIMVWWPRWTLKLKVAKAAFIKGIRKSRNRKLYCTLGWSVEILFNRTEQVK